MIEATIEVFSRLKARTAYHLRDALDQQAFRRNIGLAWYQILRADADADDGLACPPSQRGAGRALGGFHARLPLAANGLAVKADATKNEALRAVVASSQTASRPLPNTAHAFLTKLQRRVVHVHMPRGLGLADPLASMPGSLFQYPKSNLSIQDHKFAAGSDPALDHCAVFNKPSRFTWLRRQQTAPLSS
ncbi:hypothetical protein [Hydrogenophaga sp. PAMC20947]|uniref:hypothetical protein n=1 Tax=Hydrogenophaga sp. PAMC20947 TaxID=2565558 RepID=UPI001FFA8E19|nr:hypothetical protein [Hydrogenophaga sp. PAMC20947]